ncbi:MAG TPA: GNAT family N-acetyltransferase [Anaerolineae bacterium]|nr:GNAT family N-acetyltransferase [Anaerolineae bacterium]
MHLSVRPYQSEEDFWRIRSFLREVFLLNERREHSWHVARFDYWRWHLVENLQVCGSFERTITLWEAGGRLVAVQQPDDWNETRLHVHPHHRTPELEDEMVAQAEEHLPLRDGERTLYVPLFSSDTLRRQVLARRGYTRQSGRVHHWSRDLDAPLPEAPVASGYAVRSMGDLSEHPARSWASWRAFHPDEPDGAYDGDFSWYRNVQSSALYRRDLDIVAVAPGGDVSAFCTIYYDDYTRSAVCVLVGTAAEHQRRGLGRAVMSEGLRRARALGCTRAFANAYDPPADALYGSMLGTLEVSETWSKELPT